MAKELGYTPGQYNWRKHDFSENVHTTLFYIYSFLEKGTVNSRIKERTDGFFQGYPLRVDFEEINWP